MNLMIRMYHIWNKTDEHVYKNIFIFRTNDICARTQTNLVCKLNDVVYHNKWVPLLHIKLNFDMYWKSSKIQYVLYFIPVFPAVKKIIQFIIQYWI